MANARYRKKDDKQMATVEFSSDQMHKMLFQNLKQEMAVNVGGAQAPRKDDRGNLIITGDEVKYHPNTDPSISIPEGMTYNRLYDVIKRLEEEQNTRQNFSKVFDARPQDGAYAASFVLKEMFGVTVGKTLINPMTGEKILPQTVTVKTGPGPKDTATVPWGAIAIPTLDGVPVVHLGGAQHKKYGAVFTIVFESPKKHKYLADELFTKITAFLETNSIYRGKALTGVEELEFIDLSRFDGSKFVFSDEVTDLLENGLFSTIRNADLLASNGISVKRSALLYGPYGTGKTSIGMMLAQEANRYGWTFIQARPGHDRAQDVIQTAMLYQPAVVVLEDFDVESSGANSASMSQLLEALDGATTKGARIITVATTNHIKKIHPGLLRPGRLDYVVEIGALDVHGVERLIKVVVGHDRLSEDVDYDLIFAQMDEFEPSFVKATVDRAKQWAINRTQSLDYVLTTDDLVGAARSLHQQQKLMKEANEIPEVPKLDVAVREAVQSSIEDMRVVDWDGDTNPNVTRMTRSQNVN